MFVKLNRTSTEIKGGLECPTDQQYLLKSQERF